MKKENYTEKHTVRFKPSEDEAVKKAVEIRKKDYDKYKASDYIRECVVNDLRKKNLLDKPK